jgi:hypothetical protein
MQQEIVMKLFQPKQFYYLFTFLCLHTLAMASGQNSEGNNGANSSTSLTALSEAVNDEVVNAIIRADSDSVDYNPVIDPASFVSTIDNPYFTLTPGKVWVYKGKDEDGETERVEVEVTHDTKTVLGVVTKVVREREWKDGKLEEDTFDWYAQDMYGNVWYFGEDSKAMADGKVAGTEGSWEAGVKGAKPGIIMKAYPRAGDVYRQEFLKGEAEDMGQILSLSQSISIGLGNFKNCLQTQNWTPLAPDVVEYKFYSKEVGNVVLEKNVAGESGQLELIAMKTE